MYPDVHDERQRSDETDDSASGDRTRRDVQHVGALDVLDAHVLDEACRFGRERSGQPAAEILDGRDEDQIRQHTAARHERRDTRSDDVPDAEQDFLDRDGRRVEGAPNTLVGYSLQVLKTCWTPYKRNPNPNPAMIVLPPAVASSA